MGRGRINVGGGLARFSGWGGGEGLVFMVMVESVAHEESHDEEDDGEGLLSDVMTIE